jgi:hypothetical protein
MIRRARQASEKIRRRNFITLLVDSVQRCEPGKTQYKVRTIRELIHARWRNWELRQVTVRGINKVHNVILWYALTNNILHGHRLLLRKVGRRAPEPTLGQSELDYRKETCRMMKRAFLPQNHKLYQVNWRGIKSDSVLNALEPDLLSAVLVEAWNPAHVSQGQLLQRDIVDDTGRVKERRSIGQESFVKQMGRPGRRVVSFMNNPALMPKLDEQLHARPAALAPSPRDQQAPQPPDAEPHSTHRAAPPV